MEQPTGDQSRSFDETDRTSSTSEIVALPPFPRPAPSVRKLHSAASHPSLHHTQGIPEEDTDDSTQYSYAPRRGSYLLFPNRKSSLANSVSSASTSPSSSHAHTPTSAWSSASSATTAPDLCAIYEQDQESVYRSRHFHQQAQRYAKPSREITHVTSPCESSWFDDSSRPPSSLSLDDQYSELDSASSFVDSCQFDTHDWFANCKTDIDISDEAPSDNVLSRAAALPVFDANGKSRTFGDLCSPESRRPEEFGQRQLVIFIRHFFCGACRAYISRIVEQINLEAYFAMAIPTQIIVIGCGSPDLIKQYKTATSCPFPIFADPSRELFKLLGMNISFNMLGKSRPEYMRNINPAQWIAEQSKFQMKSKGGLRLKAKGGNIFQIGGEFLFEDGRVVWCHRMRNYRGHAEVDTIKRVLGI